MKDGFMQQVDTPINLYDYPINQFVAGFIGTPQMNFFTGVLTGTKNKVCVEFGMEKIELPADKVKLICNLDKYLNTGREVVFGIRPEDVSDEAGVVENAKNGVIEVKVDVVEALGSETLLYCKTREEDSGEEKSIADDVSNLVAKVDSRSVTKRDMTIKVALDLEHCHLFDKETEITVLARSEDNKSEIEALQAKREEEEARKAEEAARKLAEEEAKKAAELEKKMAKLAKKNKKSGTVVEELTVEEITVETDKKEDENK